VKEVKEIRFKQVAVSESKRGVTVIGLDENGQLWEYISLTMYEDKNHKRAGWRKFNSYILEE
jgi:hypothetical protein